MTLERRQPLRAGKPLTRREALKRSKRRMRQRSKAGDAYEREFAAAKPAIKARSGGRCEAHVPQVCHQTAGPVHHIKRRSQGGSNTHDNLLHLCTWCHDWIHNHPASARKLGLLA